MTAATAIAVVVKYFLMKKNFLSNAVQTISNIAPSKKIKFYNIKKKLWDFLYLNFLKAPTAKKLPKYLEHTAKPTRILVSSSGPNPGSPKSPIISPDPSRLSGKTISTGRSISSGKSQ